MKIDEKEMLPSKEKYLKAADLVNEVNDAMAEQLCGGAITNPQITGENTPSTTTTTGKKTSMPSPTAYHHLGLTPFLPDLPAAKLPRLKPLDPASRTAPTAKDSITVTIPLPSSPVWS